MLVKESQQLLVALHLSNLSSISERIENPDREYVLVVKTVFNNPPDSSYTQRKIVCDVFYNLDDDFSFFLKRT